MIIFLGTSNKKHSFFEIEYKLLINESKSFNTDEEILFFRIEVKAERYSTDFEILPSLAIPDFIRSNNSSKFYSFGPSGKLLPDQMDTDIQAIEDNFISISILDYSLSVDPTERSYYREVFDCE